jgi:hypothetical protein
MQVVKLVRILQAGVVSCFTPFKKVLFFHTKSLKEKKRVKRQGENVGLLQVISSLTESYSLVFVAENPLSPYKGSVLGKAGFSPQCC